jgi:cob(I)alamin adenosyltransferase
MRTKGKIIIYYSQGEGKTSAALGRAIRMTGQGKKVIILQLMKGRKTGEYKFLKRIQKRNIFPIEIYLLGPQAFLTKKAGFLLHQKKVKKALSLAEKILLEGKTNLLVLDEILYALKFKLIKEKEILDLLEKRRKTNIILTGQELTKNLRQIADQVSKASKIKHYFDKGKKATRGLDY